MEKEEHLIGYGEKAKLDQKDKNILEVLDKNARLSIANISRKTGIQRDSVFIQNKKDGKVKCD